MGIYKGAVDDIYPHYIRTVLLDSLIHEFSFLLELLIHRFLFLLCIAVAGGHCGQDSHT